MTEIPPYLRPSLIGRASGMTRKAARGMLSRAGILEQLGGHWVVGESRLRERLPEVYDRVFTYIALGPETTRSYPTITKGARAR